MDGRVMVNASDLAVRAAVDGLGIAYTIEALAEPFLRSGQLVRVLEEWSPLIEGLFLYYPGHRQVPATLRALIDMIRVVARLGASETLNRRTPSRRTERIEFVLPFDPKISQRTAATHPAKKVDSQTAASNTPKAPNIHPAAEP